MIRTGLPAAILVLLAGCAAVRTESETAVQCPETEALRSAADGRASDDPIASARPEHEALRRRLGAGLPNVSPMVLIHALSRHHETTEWSIVATRRRGGMWHVDEVGERRAGMLRIESVVLPRRERVLNAEDSRRVDALLEGPCLFTEPAFFFRPDSIGAGSWQTTVEIATPRRRRVSRAVGRVEGLTGRLVDLLVPRPG